MSLVKRNKFLEKTETVELYLEIILIGCFIFLIIQNPGEIFTERMWLVLLILFTGIVFYNLILNKYKTGKWNDDGNNELNELRKILGQSKENKYPSLIFEHKYDDYLLELEDINRLIQNQVEYCYKIKDENPKKIKIIEDELSRYGDLINNNDIEYITRANKIRELKKEVVSVKLQIERLKGDYKRKEYELAVKLVERKKDQ